MDVMLLKSLLLGAIALGSVVAGLFFLRFWRTTNDRLFLYISIALFLQALDRVLLGITMSSEENPAIYLIRLLSYGLIIGGIVEKNREKSPSLTSGAQNFRKI